MKKVISSFPYAFSYMYGLGLALTIHIGQYHQCNLTLSSNTLIL